VGEFQEDSESADNLAAHLDKELEKYDIDRTHLVFVTDGAKNIINALKALKIQRLYCMDHCLNIILKTMFTMKLVDLKMFGEDGEDIYSCAQEAINYVRSARRQKSAALKRLKKPPESSESEFQRYCSRVPCMQDLLVNFDEVRPCF
jgi:hypothetical protein